MVINHLKTTFTFTFMHVADTFIQSDLQTRHFCQYVCFLGIEPTTFCAANAMLYHWATGMILHSINRLCFTEMYCI